jgi:hypothetical protein
MSRPILGLSYFLERAKLGFQPRILESRIPISALPAACLPERSATKVLSVKKMIGAKSKGPDYPSLAMSVQGPLPEQCALSRLLFIFSVAFAPILSH